MVKLWDNNPSTSSATAFALRPHIQLDIGEFRTDIRIVQVRARNDADLHQSQNLNIYVSPTTDFAGFGGRLCRSNVSPMSLGAAVNVSCPGDVYARYVTVQKDNTSHLNIGEIAAFIGKSCTLSGVQICVKLHSVLLTIYALAFVRGYACQCKGGNPRMGEGFGSISFKAQALYLQK